MKKQIITIEREVRDEVNDAQTVAAYEHPGYRVSVVSEPIPEPIVLKVTYSGPGDPSTVRVNDPSYLGSIVEDRLNAQPLWGGSFHVEVVPQ